MNEEQEPDLNEQFEDKSTLAVWVNAGFGGRSYACNINSDSTMTLPEGLVRELGMRVGDELEWSFDDEAGVIYVKLIHKEWEVPDWLKEE